MEVASPTRLKSFRPHDLSRFAYMKVVSSTLQPKIFCEDRWTYCPQGAAVVFDRITVKLVHRKIVVDLEESTDAKHGACKVESRCTEPPRETKIGSKTPRGRGAYLTKFNTGRFRPEVQPLTLLYTILAEKVPLSHTYFRKSCSHFHVVLNK